MPNSSGIGKLDVLGVVTFNLFLINLVSQQKLTIGICHETVKKKHIVFNKWTIILSFIHSIHSVILSFFISSKKMEEEPLSFDV